MSGLPSFQNPPVVETVFSVQFAPVEGWKIPHFGLFWNSIRDEFPKCDVHHPLGQNVETFGVPQGTPRLGIELTGVAEARCWFTRESDGDLIQMQNDRFIYNWRKFGAKDVYPRYEDKVLPNFLKYWDRYNHFLNSESIPSPEVNQCEITYVNHIEKGSGWDTSDDWVEMLKVFGDCKSECLGSPESSRIKISYAMPDQRGRLHVSVNQAVRTEDQKQVVVFNLTARGKPISSETADVVDFLNNGREWIVRGFKDLTTQKMHTLWGIE